MTRCQQGHHRTVHGTAQLRDQARFAIAVHTHVSAPPDGVPGYALDRGKCELIQLAACGFREV
eukprot:15192410-Alexandrium_andersonii.AAC.1